MAKVDTNTSQVINLLRLPLAFLIVAGHANTLKFPLTDADGNLVVYDFDIIMYPIHLMSDTLFGPAVPLFFMISGFLFFAGQSRYDITTYKQKMLRKAKTLLIPYLIWNIVYMVPTLVTTFMGMHDYGVWYFVSSLWIDPNQYNRITEMTMATPADPPLWFIRDLMVCMILSPIVWIVVRHKWICIIVLSLFALPYLLCMAHQYPFPGISVPSMLFFSLGSAIAVWKIDLARHLNKTYLSWILIGVYTVLAMMVLSQVDYTFSSVDDKVSVTITQNPYLYIVTVFVGCLAFLSLAYLIISQICNDRRIYLGGAFSVFASHWILLILARKIIAHFVSAEISQITGLLLYLLLVIVGFGGGVVINYLISRNRTLLKLFAGGRS